MLCRLSDFRHEHIHSRCNICLDVCGVYIVAVIQNYKEKSHNLYVAWGTLCICFTEFTKLFIKFHAYHNLSFSKAFFAVHHHPVKPAAFRSIYKPLRLRDLQEKSVTFFKILVTFASYSIKKNRSFS